MAVAFVSHAPSPGNFAAWEGEVTDLIAEALDASYSDAQGVVEAQPLCMQLAWSMGMSVQEAAAKILADATSAA
ncbi:hypothetical protein ppKF707_2433 [Metapseudomonas furukawaii]|uniref:Uncharacterized protein n=1 Tax=Metapseudomonas furukawaii TaxID=1149133 RepID=A0AAD1C685_METFU|nr:hypothetical protein ppKF707_2433 [Pseudomonas furukawaii]BAU77436.1 hypothetical protein KF707C_p470 [Pseudomonas furukawaii]